MKYREEPELDLPPKWFDVFDADFEGGRHEKRVEKFTEIEKNC